MGLEMQQAMRRGFLDLAKGAPERFAVVDAGRAVEAVADDVLAVVRAAL